MVLLVFNKQKEKSFGDILCYENTGDVGRPHVTL